MNIERPLPPTVELCVRWKDGWFCLGQVYAGACTRCGEKGAGQEYVLPEALPRIQHALRTRPDYDLRCDGCGAPHNLDTSIPSDIWNLIAPDGGVLCTLCIDDRVAALGLTTECEFYFFGKAVESRLYADSLGDRAAAARGEATPAPSQTAADEDIPF